MTRTILLSALAGATLVGCAHPRNLQDGFGETYQTAMQVQADRGRPTAANAAYSLTGFEGIELRQNVTEDTTDTESGTMEVIESFQVE